MPEPSAFRPGKVKVPELGERALPLIVTRCRSNARRFAGVNHEMRENAAGYDIFIPFRSGKNMPRVANVSTNRARSPRFLRGFHPCDSESLMKTDVQSVAKAYFKAFRAVFRAEKVAGDLEKVASFCVATAGEC